MNSRYNFMTPGAVLDEVTHDTYPDPLSLNYLDLKLRNQPKKDVMSDSKISYFWKEAEICYGNAEWDDVVLTLNDVPHKNFLQIGDIIYFPTPDDINLSFRKNR